MTEVTRTCCEFFDYNGGGQLRQRVTHIVARNLRGPKTTRQIGERAPKPLSQYFNGSDQFREVHTVRGHLIALKFGGPEWPTNLVPMYPDFNAANGSWGKFENELDSWLGSAGRKVDIEIQCSYAVATSPIPSSIRVTLSNPRGGGLPDTLRTPILHQQTPPNIVRTALSENDWVLRTFLLDLNEKMVDRQWCFEDLEIRRGMVTRRGDFSRPLTVGVHSEGDLRQILAYGDATLFRQFRPYAMLDYLRAINPGLYNDLGFPSFTYDNTSSFTSIVPFIRKVNELMNDGYLRSDLYGLTKHEKVEFLTMGSCESQAQVDHIAGKADSGSNCFSNARLISGRLNRLLNTKDLRPKVEADIDRTCASMCYK